jgi:hypothetical protein
MHVTIDSEHLSKNQVRMQRGKISEMLLHNFTFRSTRQVFKMIRLLHSCSFLDICDMAMRTTGSAFIMHLLLLIAGKRLGESGNSIDKLVQLQLTIESHLSRLLQCRSAQTFTENTYPLLLQQSKRTAAAIYVLFLCLHLSPSSFFRCARGSIQFQYLF